MKIVERDENQTLKNLKINEFEFGLRPNYSKIGTYASDSYANKKYSQNALAGYGQVDLIHTGAFVNSLFVKQQGEGFIFDASNDKKDMLGTAYGDDIFGLNQKTFNKYQANDLAPKLVKFIKQQLKQ